MSTTTPPHSKDAESAAEVLRGKVFLYLGANARAAEFAPLADGLIFRGKPGFLEARKLPVPPPTIAVDLERYASDRGFGDNQLLPLTAEESIRAQLAVGADFLLAPSRFPPQGDTAAFDRVLDDGAAFVDAAASIAPSLPAFVPVVIRFDDLEARTWVPALTRAQLPVATVFAGFRDPLGTPTAMSGALEVIQASPRTLALRCDLSGAGLTVHGGHCTAIGTSSPARHLWLPSARKPARPRDIHAMIPSLGAWLSSKTLTAAAADSELHDIFGCACNTCGPDGDVRQLVAFDVSPDDRAALFELHSAHTSVLIVKRIIAASSPQQAWADYLNACHENFAKLRTAGLVVEEPPMLAAWRQVLGAS